jgi:hypothetical protein
VVRVGAAVGLLRPEPGQYADGDELAQSLLGEVDRWVESVSDLERGEQTVVVEPAEQDVVAVEPAYRPQLLRSLDSPTQGSRRFAPELVG